MQHIERGLPLGITIGLCQVALNDQPVSVFHQRMPDKAEHRAGSRRFLVKPRFRIGRRGMGGVGALLAFEVDLGISAAMIGAEH